MTTIYNLEPNHTTFYLGITYNFHYTLFLLLNSVLNKLDKILKKCYTINIGLILECCTLNNFD